MVRDGRTPAAVQAVANARLNSPTPGIAPGGNSLIGAIPGLAIIYTGTPTGPVDLTVELHRTAPAVRLDDWDDIVEIAQQTPCGSAAIIEPATTAAAPGYPFLRLAPGAWFRLRVSVRGRDRGRQIYGVATESVEDHLLQTWPGPPSPTEIRHKLTDQLGAALRGDS